VVRVEVGHHGLFDSNGVADHDGLLQSPVYEQRHAFLSDHPDCSRDKRIGGVSGPITKGAPIFRLDSSKQEAAVETARRKIAEVQAELAVAQADVVKADGQIQEARSAHQQAVDELETKRELQRRNPGNVAFREIQRLEVSVEGRLGAIASATAAKQAAEERISSLLPAQKASAEAALAQAEADLDKTVIRAGVSGRVEQFALRVGDVVNPFMRPAGVLIPEGAGQRVLFAGFGQIEGQIMKAGMIAETTCVSKPWTIIPMVVTDVQDFIAAGQFRGGEQLVDAAQVTRPGTLLVFLEPLYKGGLDGVTPGSSCIANAYSNNHDTIVSPDTGAVRRVMLHVGCPCTRARLNSSAPGAGVSVSDSRVQRTLTPAPIGPRLSL
jgi:multidrug resistance efflux pump